MADTPVAPPRVGQGRKLAAIAVLFTAWLWSDLASKDWADKTLADRRHPQVLRVGPDDAGKTLSELVAARLNIDDAKALESALQSTVRLPAAMAMTAETSVYGDPKLQRVPSFYVFWRGLDAPPRRIDKDEQRDLERWIRAASPDAPPDKVRAEIAGQIDGLTMGPWLVDKIRRVTDADIPGLLEAHILPLQPPLVGVRPEQKVADGDAFAVRFHRVDVMGDWWKYTYAENTGAAFGFMKNVEPSLKEAIFGGLTVVIACFLLWMLWTLEPKHKVVLFALTSVLAGAAGNFVDRIRYGYVIDFIDMDLGFMHWPTYNIADIAISVGVILMLGDMLLNPDSPLNEPDKKKQAEAKAKA